MALTVPELDALLRGLVFDKSLEACHPTAHWHFYSYMAEERKGQEKTLMCSFKTRYLSVRRIMWILHYQEDPVQQRHLDQLCGDETCVNPLHMSLIK